MTADERVDGGGERRADVHLIRHGAQCSIRIFILANEAGICYAAPMKNFTSHDVRRMHLCSECNKFGVHGSDLATTLDAPLLVRVGQNQFAHPKCLRIELLALLSRDELGEIRLGDVSAQTMETILLAFRNGLHGGNI